MTKGSYIEHQADYKGETIVIWVRDGIRSFEWGNVVFYTMKSMKSFIDRQK